MSTQTYPQWALEAYGDKGLDMEGLAAKQRSVSFLNYAGGVLCALTLITFFVFQSSFFRSKLHINFDSHWFWIFTPFFLGIVLIITAGVKSSGEELGKKRSFETDLDELKEVLGYAPCNDMYSQKAVAVDVHDTLINDAVWIRIYELTQNGKRAKEKREEMCDHFDLFRRFNFVPDVSSWVLSGLPVKQFFDAAEPKVVETLNFALTRQSRQAQGLPI